MKKTACGRFGFDVKWMLAGWSRLSRLDSLPPSSQFMYSSTVTVPIPAGNDHPHCAPDVGGKFTSRLVVSNSCGNGSGLTGNVLFITALESIFSRQLAY